MVKLVSDRLLILRMKITSKEIRELRKRPRFGKVAKAILCSVGAVGFLTMAMIAPNAVQMLGVEDSRRKEWYMYKVRDDLVRRGLLQKVTRGKRNGYELTDKGEEIATAYELRNLTIKKPWNWDGNWRIVIFDIPEFRKGIREEVRSTLVSLGFIPLQKSAWVYPYPCAEIITLIKRI